MRVLSKSKIIAFRQCPKRLWLELHRKELQQVSKSSETSFRVGHEVGAVARKIYDMEGKGVEVNAQRDGYGVAYTQTAELLAQRSGPIFEAGFRVPGATAFADVMLPVGGKKSTGWRMVEVKSSTSVKEYHQEDIAVQAQIARAAGIELKKVALATVDSSWVYPGGNDYQGLLVEHDMTEAAFARADEVEEWMAEAQRVAALPAEPAVKTGDHCREPFECEFCDYCHQGEKQPKYPLNWLPKLSAGKRGELEAQGMDDLRKVPDEMLNAVQRRVKMHTTENTVYFDAVGAAQDLAHASFPVYFMDFETIQQAVPIWKGTRPYQQIPFQFSLHRLDRKGQLKHSQFLDLSGSDPSEPFAAALVGACGSKGPIYTYNAGFETSRLKDLAKRFPKYAKALRAIIARVHDLLPVARDRYYHPSQHGSWSIKAVLPAAVPELSYDKLVGVKDGDMAMAAYAEAVQPKTTRARRREIQRQLSSYCWLDTYAMVRLWRFFSGRNDLELSDQRPNLTAIAVEI
jgi:Domain of unknown function(DUF2779)